LSGIAMLLIIIRRREEYQTLALCPQKHVRLIEVIVE
jgi:hypothetical protein